LVINVVFNFTLPERVLLTSATTVRFKPEDSTVDARVAVSSRPSRTLEWMASGYEIGLPWDPTSIEYTAKTAVAIRMAMMRPAPSFMGEIWEKRCT